MAGFNYDGACPTNGGSVIQYQRVDTILGVASPHQDGRASSQTYSPRHYAPCNYSICSKKINICFKHFQFGQLCFTTGVPLYGYDNYQWKAYHVGSLPFMVIWLEVEGYMPQVQSPGLILLRNSSISLSKTKYPHVFLQDILLSP